MNWPGEALLIRLWETLAEKGIGGLLRPWQMRREGTVELEMRSAELVTLADAQREADEIRSGRISLADSQYAISLSRNKPGHTAQDRAVHVATAALIGDTLRREVNVAKAITFAEEELKQDPKAPSEKKIDDDWLHRWREYAGSVSADDLQLLWGKILSGELKEPGSYTYRALDFIRNLTVEEAKQIELLSRFVIQGTIARSQKQLLEREGLSFGRLLELQNLGLLAGVEALGLNRTFESVVKDTFVAPLCSNGRVLLLKHPDPNLKVKFEIYAVTKLGNQILTLGRFEPHEEYLLAIAKDLIARQKDLIVEIANYRDIGDGKIEFKNAVKVD